MAAQQAITIGIVIGLLSLIPKCKNALTAIQRLITQELPEAVEAQREAHRISDTETGFTMEIERDKRYKVGYCVKSLNVGDLRQCTDAKLKEHMKKYVEEVSTMGDTQLDLLNAQFSTKFSILWLAMAVMGYWWILVRVLGAYYCDSHHWDMFAGCTP